MQGTRAGARRGPVGELLLTDGMFQSSKVDGSRKVHQLCDCPAALARPRSLLHVWTGAPLWAASATMDQNPGTAGVSGRPKKFVARAHPLARPRD